MEITKTLLINAACLLIPPVVVVLLLRHFFPRKIRWSAGVVALVDLVIFWTDISYYQKAGIGGSGFTDVLPQDIKWFFVLGFQHLHGYDLQVAPQGFQMVH